MREVHAIIKVKEAFGNTLDSRHEAAMLFDSLKDYCTQCGEIVLDFSEVMFMSRAFADQFHKEKIRWCEGTNVTIFIENANDQVSEILQAVTKTQTKREVKARQQNVNSFTKEQVFVFFSSI